MCTMEPESDGDDSRNRLMRLSDELRDTIETAVEEARGRRHEYITLEHLLLALCADTVALEIFQATGVKVSRLIDELDSYLDEALEARAG